VRAHLLLSTLDDLPALARVAEARFSSHMGSNQAKGTYISTVWISFHGSLIPAFS